MMFEEQTTTNVESMSSTTDTKSASNSDNNNTTTTTPWVSGLDPNNGLTYWYNTETKISQWEDPTLPLSAFQPIPTSSQSPPSSPTIIDTVERRRRGSSWDTVRMRGTYVSVISHHHHHRKRKLCAPIVQQSLEVIAKSFKPRKVLKSVSAKVAICCAFKSKPMMFGKFEPDFFMRMIDSMIPLSTHEGECVVTQGDPIGDYFYAIEKGSCVIEIDGNVVAKLPNETAGNGFGELALMLNSPRNATVRSDGECKLWALDRETFRVMQYLQKKRKVNDACISLRSIKLLAELDAIQIRSIAEAVQIQKYNEDEIIIEKGDTEGRDFYMIQSGIVEVRNINGTKEHFSVVLQAGDSFGEAALLTAEPRNANCIAVSDDVVCMSMSYRAFTALLGSLETVIAHNYCYYTLRAVVPSLENRPDTFIRKLASLAVKEKVQQGDMLAHLYELCDRFAVIRKGVCVIEETGEELGSGACIGVEMFGSEQPAHFSQTIIAMTDVEILEISYDWMQHMGNMGDGIDQKNDDTGKEKGDEETKEYWDEVKKHVFGTGKEEDTKKEEQNSNNKNNNNNNTTNNGTTENSNMNNLNKRRKSSYTYVRTDLITNFARLGVLGNGTFGRVELVKDRRDNKLVALKIQQKQQLCQFDVVAKVQQEREIMLNISHTFICQLYGTFQDQNCIYMVLQCHNGGDLYSLVDRKGGCLSDTETKFYAAPIVSAIEYLHQQHIVYRDVKTENVVIDQQGYPVLIDFGNAKRLSENSGITFTMCGTMQFLAPEVIRGTGHSYASDCWSVGIMIYELLTGCSMFSTNVNNEDGTNEDLDPMAVMKLVLEQEIRFDATFGLNPVSTQFMTELLDRNQTTRLGCGNKFRMSKHRYFKGEGEETETDVRDIYYDDMDETENTWWYKVTQRAIEAPWIPGDAPTLLNAEEEEEGDSWKIESYKGSDDVFVGF
mgnify:CR=1 FL=1